MYSHGHDQIVVKLRQTPLCLYCGITVRLWCGVTVHLWTIKGRWTTVDTYPYSQIIILDYKYVIARSSWSFKGSAVRIKGNRPKKKKRSKTKKEKKCTKFESTVFPWIIAGGNYFFFHIRRGRLFEGGDYFKYCSLEVKPLNILFYYPIELKKIITSNKLNMGFLSVPNLVPWLIFRAWLITDIVLLDQISFQLDRERIKERVKEREGGWGGWRLLKGGDYFKYFHQSGAIFWERRLFEGRLWFEEIRYAFAGVQTHSFWEFNKWSWILDQYATQPLNNCYAKIILLKAFLSAVNAVWSWWNWIYHEFNDKLAKRCVLKLFCIILVLIHSRIQRHVEVQSWN